MLLTNSTRTSNEFLTSYMVLRIFRQQQNIAGIRLTDNLQGPLLYIKVTR